MKNKDNGLWEWNGNLYRIETVSMNRLNKYRAIHVYPLDEKNLTRQPPHKPAIPVFIPVMPKRSYALVMSPNSWQLSRKRTMIHMMVSPKRYRKLPNGKVEILS